MRCHRWGSPLLAALALLPALAIETGAASAEQPYLWGLTSDNCMEKTDRQVQALRQFPQRVTIRTVFDLPENGGPQADDYGACVKAFSAVADVMGLILDSQAMAALKPNDVAVRMAAYMARLGPDVRLWEVGNEVNGSWLGDDVLAKIEIMYDAAKAAHRLTALTLYHEVKPEPGTEMLGWVMRIFRPAIVCATASITCWSAITRTRTAAIVSPRTSLTRCSRHWPSAFPMPGSGSANLAGGTAGLPTRRSAPPCSSVSTNTACRRWRALSAAASIGIFGRPWLGITPRTGTC